MTGRRRFGTVRKLSSGRFQARWWDEASGKQVPVDTTFASKAEALRYLAILEADLLRGAWVDPRAGEITLSEYAPYWLANRPRPLRPRTVDLYTGQLRNHILPILGDIELRKISTSGVRTWLGALRATGRIGDVTVAKCYRLLHAILATAVEDEIIVKNPCVLKNAAVEHSPERPVATVGQVYALADAVGPQYRALVLMATFAGLRLGELFALTRARLDMLHGTVTVVEQLQELASGRRIVSDPKSEAGRRIVTIPAVILPDLERHLSEWAAPGRDGLVFCRADGTPIRRATWNRKWRRAARAVGTEGLHFHDLRGTGNTLAAATGASTKELMARMGHASSRAALLYQHATRDRDAAIAKALSDLVAGAVPTPPAPVASLLRRDREIPTTAQ